MTDIIDNRFLDSDTVVTKGEVRRARLYVCGKAEDVEDAKYLLNTLGLLDSEGV